LINTNECISEIDIEMRDDANVFINDAEFGLVNNDGDPFGQAAIDNAAHANNIEIEHDQVKRNKPKRKRVQKVVTDSDTQLSIADLLLPQGALPDAPDPVQLAPIGRLDFNSYATGKYPV